MPNISLQMDAGLLRRYDRSGPRYTSYPTAPQFEPAYTELDFRRFAQQSARVAHVQPLSVYVHIPFCASPCFYCGCNRVISRSAERSQHYLARLLREIDLIAPMFAGRRIAQLHFGGGTPNFLTPDQIGAIVGGLRRHFTFLSDPEISIELDPRYSRPEDFEPLAWLGVNRVSLGVQDFDHQVQVAVNRLQTREQTLATLQACRAAGIHSINIDLMYGLPRQTLTTFKQTLDQVIEANPTRLAVYGYAHMPAMFKAQRHIRDEDLPDPETRIRLLGEAIATFEAAGYQYIGMDHFAKPTDELAVAQASGDLHRNFMGYTTRAGSDLLGIGVSAISHIGNSFSQNLRDLTAWEDAIDAGRSAIWRGLAMDADDIIRADVIGQIMCQASVDIPAVERRHGIDFWSYFSASRTRLEELQSDGLLWMCASRLMITREGRYLLRIVAACFDRYLQAQSATEDTAARFSKVV
jgi:oxygen-independent coproporphyrinogen-3 oxidase